MGCTKVIEDRPHNWINGNVEKGETSRGSDVHLSFACCFLPLSINLHTMLCMIFTPFFFVRFLYSFLLFLFSMQFISIPFYSSFVSSFLLALLWRGPGIRA